MPKPQCCQASALLYVPESFNTYTHTHTHTYTYRYVCMYVCMHVCMHVHTRARAHTHTLLHMNCTRALTFENV